MVDVTQAMEGDYLNADIVRNSPTKKCIIVDAGEYVDTEYGAKLQILVEIDKKQKKWKPNKDTVKNISEEYGTDSNDWVGKIIKLSNGKFNGKDTVNGMPMPMPKTIIEKI